MPPTCRQAKAGVEREKSQQLEQRSRSMNRRGLGLTRRAVIGTAVGLAAMAAIPSVVQGADDEIILGLVSPLSEPGDARSGEAIKKTADLWVKMTNEAGGIDGKKVRLAVYDDQGKVEVGAAAVERAVTEGHASAILGIWSSSVALAQMEVAKRYNVPILAF